MSITFISVEQFIIAVLLLALTICLYFWQVQPRIVNAPGFDASKWTPWLKARWDVAAAFVVAILPMLWNGGLDLIVWISLILDQLSPALHGVDLSGFIIPERWKAGMQIAAVLLPPVRAWIIKRREASQ